jgi:hypothetical protein
MECRDTQISCIAVRVWQSHPRHVNLWKVSIQKAPKHLEILGRATTRTPHREAFIPDVKSWVSRTGLQGYKSTPTSEGHASRAPNYVGRTVNIPRYCETWVLRHANLKEAISVPR